MLFGLTAKNLAAQNLVPNPSFEDTIGGCPTGWTAMGYCEDWTGWGGTTTDYFKYCSSMAWSPASVPSNFVGGGYAKSGVAYAGFITNIIDSFFTNNQNDWNEYVMTQLKTPLNIGQLYEVKFYLKLASKSGHTTSSYGLLFSTNSQYSNSNNQGFLNETPQLKNTNGNYLLNKGDWVEFKRRFIADSTYNYITIGNFLDRFQTPMVQVSNQLLSNPVDYPYFLIDDVSIYPIYTICQGDSIELNSLGDSLYSWANSASPQTIISNDSNIMVSPTSNSAYVDYSNGDTSFYYVEVLNNNSINFGNDTNLCEGQSLILEAAIPNSAVIWQDNSTNSTFEVTQAGTYWAQVNNSCGVYSDTINVTYNTIPVNLGNDTSICFDNTFILDPKISNANYLWNTTNTTQQQQIVPNWGFINTYWVQVQNSLGCGIDTINISVVPYFENNFLGVDSTFCEGQQINVSYNSPLADSYIWSNGSTDSIITIISASQYWLELSNKCYTKSDTINVTVKPTPYFELGTDLVLCNNDKLVIGVNSLPNATAWWNTSFTLLLKKKDNILQLLTFKDVIIKTLSISLTKIAKSH